MDASFREGRPHTLTSGHRLRVTWLNLACCCTQCARWDVGSGQVKVRPGILRLMEEARGAGLKLAVCSAGTKSSVVFVVEQLLGTDRFQVCRWLLIVAGFTIRW